MNPGWGREAWEESGAGEGDEWTQGGMDSIGTSSGRRRRGVNEWTLGGVERREESGAGEVGPRRRVPEGLAL